MQNKLSTREWGVGEREEFVVLVFVSGVLWVCGWFGIHLPLTISFMTLSVPRNMTLPQTCRHPPRFMLALLLRLAMQPLNSRNQRIRFADPQIRKCDSIRSVWLKYTTDAGGSSIRQVHEREKDAWSAKRTWADNKLFQAWQKWESIIDGVNLYADALSIVEQQLDRSAAEERVVQVLEFRQQRLKYNLQRFREQILTKQALGDARLRGFAVLGYELMQDYQNMC
eukprot:jgi/Botrbrau1/16078/Bobra.7_2s0049.1